MTKGLKKTEDAEILISHCLKLIDEKDYSQAKLNIDRAYELYKAENSIEGISICMSLIAFLNYSTDKNKFESAMSLLNDATYMAKRSLSNTAELINELVLGNINFSELNKDVALIHYNNALKLSVEEDRYFLADTINTRIRQLQNGMDYSLPTKSDPLVSLVKISRSITALTDIDELLKVVAEETKNAIQADRCTVFLWDKDTDELWSKVALGLDSSQEIRFPADKGLAGYVVKTGESLNIADAYNDPRFNPEVDSKTGYKTKTILCMPIMNNNREIIGAFQVINKIAGKSVEVKTERISNVVIYGPTDVIQKLTADDLVAEYDMEGSQLDNGSYEANVRIYAPNVDTVWCYGSYEIIVSISDEDSE